MKVNDRGTMKWTSLMLPEHVDLLREVWAELEYKEKPVLDEQQQQDNFERIKTAVENYERIFVEYYDHENKTRSELIGYVNKINRESININEKEIKFSDLIYVE